MKNFIKVFLFFLVHSVSAQITFQNIYDYGRPLFIEQQADSGYTIMCKDSLNPYGVNMMRLDQYGDTLWTKYITNPGFRVESVCKGIDSGYVIAGNAHAGSQIDYAFYAKLTNSGTVEWSNRLVAADSFCTTIQTICKTSDSCYIGAGRYSIIPGSFHGNTFMIKINSQGDTLWTKVGSSTPNRISNMIQAPGDGMLIGGNRSLSYLLSKIDNNGNPLWESNYFNPVIPGLIMEMVIASDGNILCIGILNATSSTSGALDVFKMDSTGVMIWSKRISSYYGTFGYSIATRPDGGFYLFGKQLDTTFTDSGNMYLASMDSSGTLLWDRLYGFPSENDGYKIISTFDGGALLAGTHGQPEKLYLVKIDSTGYGGCNESVSQTTLSTVVLSDSSYAITLSNPSMTEFPITFTYESGRNYYDVCSSIGIAESPLNTFRIFPNPANDFITVLFGQAPERSISLKLFDIAGKLIQSFSTVNQENFIYLKNVVDGIYFIKISDENKLYGTKKLIVNKQN